jgi:hypothetical protein
MYETVCTKIKLKPGSQGRAREWAAEIGRRAEEARATLRQEGVVVESVFLESGAEGDFLIYYMKAENMERARAAGRASRHAIDEYHHRMMSEICESGQRLELLVDLDLIGEPPTERMKAEG